MKDTALEKKIALNCKSVIFHTLARDVLNYMYSKQH